MIECSDTLTDDSRRQYLQRYTDFIQHHLIDNNCIYLCRKFNLSNYFQEGSPTNRSVRSRLQALRDERCGLNGLRNIGNTVSTSLTQNVSRKFLPFYIQPVNIHTNVLVFYEQRDSVLEQHEASVRVSAERTIPGRHKYYDVKYERRFDQSVQPSDSRIVGGGR